MGGVPMIDIHCHILPEVDDGARNVEESLEMARAAVKQGIRTIIATPHHQNQQYNNPKPQILQKTSELNAALKEASIPLTVLPGQETRIYGDLLVDFHKEEILSLNHTNYLFIELPSGQVPRYTEQLLFEIQMQGLIPIIVHPERNQGFIENPGLLYQLVKKGAMSQVTAASVTGAFGKKIKHFSQQLIEANLTHFIASDAHNTSNRGFLLAEALDHIEDKYGTDMVYMFIENAELIVTGKMVYKEIPEKITRKKFLGIF